jgi:hypothetical protein
MNYGNPPRDLGLIDLSPTEMMFWMYCPIAVPFGCLRLPDNLQQFEPIVDAAMADVSDTMYHVYITAKTLWVSGGYIGNRPGWHTDGFGCDDPDMWDLNYIWSDRAPTEFLIADPRDPIRLSTDCERSMEQMEFEAKRQSNHIETFPDKHLLRLDPSVIHRSPVDFEPGMRTFVKISFSHDEYNLEGNSINHDLLASHWPTVARGAERNHPSRSEQ